MDHLTEQDAGLLEQAATMLEERAEEQRTWGNDSAAEGAACSAHAIRRLAPALLRAGHGCLAQIEEPAAPAAVAGPANDLAELAMLNKLVELGTQAYGALAESNSDDGPAGTAAYVRWQERRAEMGELIRAHKAPALEAPAAPLLQALQVSRQPDCPEGHVLRDWTQGWNECAAYVERVALEAAPQAPAAPSAHAGLLAAAAHIQAKAQAHLDERGSYDPDTGAVEMSESNQEHFNTLDELAEEIRMMAEKAAPASCDKPPAGWTCSRAPGYDGPCAAAPAAPAVDAFTHAELLEIKRAVEDFADCNETDVDYALLLRAAQAGYLECTQFHVLNQSALDLDTVAAAQAKEGGA